MIKRPFEQWLFEDVEIEFGIEPKEELLILKEWLEISEEEALPIPEHLEKLRQFLYQNVKIWNEDELKMQFIAPFLSYFHFHNMPHYRVFSQRFMRLQTETVEAAGKIEWMIAIGKQTPRKPFFFLQEYKPEKNTGNDPLGQLLIAMVDAQLLNETPKKPIYGCYMIGRFWFFVVLLDKEYGVSRAYDATQKDDMADMIVILKRVRRHIHQELGLPIED